MSFVSKHPVKFRQKKRTLNVLHIIAAFVTGEVDKCGGGYMQCLLDVSINIFVIVQPRDTVQILPESMDSSLPHPFSRKIVRDSHQLLFSFSQQEKLEKWRSSTDFAVLGAVCKAATRITELQSLKKT